MVWVSAGNCERTQSMSSVLDEAVEEDGEMTWSAVGMDDIVIQECRLDFVAVPCHKFATRNTEVHWGKALQRRAIAVPAAREIPPSSKATQRVREDWASYFC